MMIQFYYHQIVTVTARFLKRGWKMKITSAQSRKWFMMMKFQLKDKKLPKIYKSSELMFNNIINCWF